MNLISNIRSLFSSKTLCFISCYLSIFGALFIATTQAQSQDSLILEAINLAESGLSRENIQNLRSAHEMLGTIPEHESDLAQSQYYYLGYIDYQLAILLMSVPDSSNMLENQNSPIEHIDRAIDYLKKSINFNKKNEYAAEAYALLSMTYGQKIRLKPRSAMINGIRSRRNIQRAKKLISDNPRIVLAESISNFNTPSEFGGSRENGLAGFRQAVSLFNSKQDASHNLPHWGEVEAHTWLGIAYMNSKQYQLAKDAFEKALEINPNYGWVKYNLLPQLETLASSISESDAQ